MKISAVIITFNEENNIAEAIKSIDWADEILVVDSHSTDNTVKIAESLGAKVLLKPWEGFSKQKQFAADSAVNNWIFSLDADERISNKLKSEILELRNLPASNRADGYKIPRLSFYMNRPIRHGGWYPDWQLRLFDRRCGKWKNVLVHESFKMEENKKVGKLSGDILHYGFENAAHHHQVIGTRYAPLAARQMFERGQQTSPLKIITAGLTTFLQTYFLKSGFLDGLAGFSIAKFAAQHAFLKHLMLWEMQNSEKLKAESEKLN